MNRYFSPDKKKVIFFDMNNTLMGRKQPFASLFVEVLDEFTARWNMDKTNWDPRTVLYDYQKEWKTRKHSRAKERLSPERQQFACLRNALRRHSFPVTNEFLETFFRRLKSRQADEVQLYPDVPETLTALSKQYRLAIISNGVRDDLLNQMRKSGLSAIIPTDLLFSSSKDIPKKPHPAIFRHALKTMDIDAGMAVMVGNSWRHDVMGATQLGMDAVWIQRAHKKNGARKKIGKAAVVTIRKFAMLRDLF